MEQSQIIFIISLPRSGSTLLQKLLCTQDKVDSISEPWLMLPLVSMLKPSSTKAQYSHKKSSEFINDMIQEMPGEINSFYEKLRHFVLDVYSELPSDDSHFFIDKTPRYHLILDELHEIFPAAKFIYLVRNPIQITSSIMNSSNMCDNNLAKLHGYHLDLYTGFNNMANSIKVNMDKIHIVNYDSLVENNKKEIEGVCKFLNINFNDEALLNWKSISFLGAAGDETGIYTYHSVSQDSKNKWKSEKITITRKMIIRNVIQGISKSNLDILGYQKDNLLTDLRRVELDLNPLKNIKDYVNYLSYRTINFMKRKVLNY